MCEMSVYQPKIISNGENFLALAPLPQLSTLLTSIEAVYLINYHMNSYYILKNPCSVDDLEFEVSNVHLKWPFIEVVTYIVDIVFIWFNIYERSNLKLPRFRSYCY